MCFESLHIFKIRKKNIFVKKAGHFYIGLCHFSGHFVCTQKYMGQKFVNFAKKNLLYNICMRRNWLFQRTTCFFIASAFDFTKKKSNENVP